MSKKYYCKEKSDMEAYDFWGGGGRMSDSVLKWISKGEKA